MVSLVLSRSKFLQVVFGSSSPLSTMIESNAIVQRVEYKAAIQRSGGSPRRSASLDSNSHLSLFLSPSLSVSNFILPQPRTTENRSYSRSIQVKGRILLHSRPATILFPVSERIPHLVLILFSLNCPDFPQIE